jgi:type I restriction enzyme, S subunit
MSGWPRVRLGEIARIDRDGIDPRSIPAGTLYVGLEHIEAGGRLINVNSVSNGELESTKFRFGANHLLYGKLRPYLAKIALPDFNGICSTDILPVLPSKKLDRRYLAYFLRQPQMVEYASSRSEGINLPRLSPKTLAQFEIPLPPLPEQERIARILDQADELRRKRRTALAEVDKLPQAIFVEMFGDPVLNVRQWPKRKLGEVGELERGVSKHRPRNDLALLNGPYPLIQTGDIANCDGYIREYTSSYSEAGLRQSRLWPKGTLCITIAANIGKTGILLFDSCFPDSVVGFTPRDMIMTEYVQSWMSFVQRKLENDAPEFAQKNINLGILRVPSSCRLLDREGRNRSLDGRRPA